MDGPSAARAGAATGAETTGTIFPAWHRTSPSDNRGATSTRLLRIYASGRQVGDTAAGMVSREWNRAHTTFPVPVGVV